MEVDNDNTTIEKQVNINELKSAEFFNGASITFRKAEKLFEDPTQTYSISSSTIKAENFDGLNSKIEALVENRVILINSLDHSFLSPATYAITERLQEEREYDCRVLEFKDNNLNRTDLYLDIFTNQKISQGEFQIIVVHLTNVLPAENFFYSLFERTNSGDVIKSSLRTNNIFVIVIYSSIELMNKFEERKSQFHFLEWNISYEKYLRELLTQKFSEEEANYLHENIIEQKKYGLFGDDEIEFYQKISKKLKEGKRALRDEIGSNIEKVKIQEEKGEKVIKRIGAEELLGKFPIGKELLYVAAFFPQLSFREFKKLILFILDGKQGEIEIEEEYTTKKGKAKSRKVKKTIQLLKYFKDNSDRTFQNACLEEIRTKTLTTVIDFNEPYLRKEVKKYYQQKFPSYTKQQFEDIINSDLLFDIEASNQFIDNIVKLVVDTALGDPDYFGRNLLIQIGLGKFVLKESEAQLDKDDRIIGALKEILGLKTFERYHNLNRLASLIGEMLEYEQLKKSVVNFFGSLIQTWKSPEVVLEILERLRYTKNIDKLFWLKRIFNEVSNENKKLKQRAYNYLILLGRQSSLEIYEFLDRIKEWQPSNRNRHKTEKDELHSLYGLSFLYSYAVSIAYTLPKKYYGEYPSKYILFARFHQMDEREVKDKINFLVVWLFHENLNGLLYNINSDFSENSIYSIADLIERWALILLGNSKKQQSLSSEYSRNIVKFFLIAIKKNTGRFTQMNLKSAWLSKAKSYLKQITSIPIQQKVERKRLQFKCNNLKELVKAFDKTK